MFTYSDAGADVIHYEFLITESILVSHPIDVDHADVKSIDNTVSIAVRDTDSFAIHIPIAVAFYDAFSFSIAITNAITDCNTDVIRFPPCFYN